MNLIVVGIALPWLVVALGCWIGYLLVRQNGRILLRLETVEEQLSQLRTASAAPARPAPARPPGLAMGSEAPAFELPDLDGARRSLAEFRGQRALLIFFNPGCGYCRQMAPDLAALPGDGSDGRPVTVLVSTGGAEANRELVKEHGLRCPVLLQEKMEVGARYAASGTPTGYRIDAEGRIASELAIGAAALLALWEAPAGAAPVLSTNGSGHKEHQGNRSLADSRLNRSGLAAGTPAPNFTLPRLDGGELSLEEYRGRPLLLVFSDPKCGPCSALDPVLEEAYRRPGAVPVVMVSRGEAEPNRAKVARNRLTFPVVLQRQWEVSRDYAMFATPVAYWIDAEGRIAADVAEGVESILELYSRAVAATSAATNGRAGAANRRAISNGADARRKTPARR